MSDDSVIVISSIPTIFLASVSHNGLFAMFLIFLKLISVLSLLIAKALVYYFIEAANY